MPGFSTKSIRSESHCYSTEGTKGGVSTYNTPGINFPSFLFLQAKVCDNGVTQDDAWYIGYSLAWLAERAPHFNIERQQAQHTISHILRMPEPPCLSRLPTRMSSAVRFTAGRHASPTSPIVAPHLVISVRCGKRYLHVHIRSFC